MYINSINPYNQNFTANINLDVIAGRLKYPEKIEKVFSSLTRDYPNDKLVLREDIGGWLNISAFDEFGNTRQIDLPSDILDKLLEHSQTTIVKKLVLAFKTLKMGITRDNDVRRQIIELAENKSLNDVEDRIFHFQDVEKHRTSKIMIEMLEKDDILLEALFQ